MDRYADSSKFEWRFTTCNKKRQKLREAAGNARAARAAQRAEMPPPQRVLPAAAPELPVAAPELPVAAPELPAVAPVHVTVEARVTVAVLKPPPSNLRPEKTHIARVVDYMEAPLDIPLMTLLLAATMGTHMTHTEQRAAAVLTTSTGHQYVVTPDTGTGNMALRDVATGDTCATLTVLTNTVTDMECMATSRHNGAFAQQAVEVANARARGKPPLPCENVAYVSVAAEYEDVRVVAVRVAPETSMLAAMNARRLGSKLARALQDVQPWRDATFTVVTPDGATHTHRVAKGDCEEMSRYALLVVHGGVNARIAVTGGDRRAHRTYVPLEDAREPLFTPAGLATAICKEQDTRMHFGDRRSMMTTALRHVVDACYMPTRLKRAFFMQRLAVGSGPVYEAVCEAVWQYQKHLKAVAPASAILNPEVAHSVVKTLECASIHDIECMVTFTAQSERTTPVELAHALLTEALRCDSTRQCFVRALHAVWTWAHMGINRPLEVLTDGAFVHLTAASMLAQLTEDAHLLQHGVGSGRLVLPVALLTRSLVALKNSKTREAEAARVVALQVAMTDTRSYNDGWWHGMLEEPTTCKQPAMLRAALAKARHEGCMDMDTRVHLRTALVAVRAEAVCMGAPDPQRLELTLQGLSVLDDGPFSQEYATFFSACDIMFFLREAMRRDTVWTTCVLRVHNDHLPNVAHWVDYVSARMPVVVQYVDAHHTAIYMHARK